GDLLEAVGQQSGEVRVLAHLEAAKLLSRAGSILAALNVSDGAEPPPPILVPGDTRFNELMSKTVALWQSRPDCQLAEGFFHEANVGVLPYTRIGQDTVFGLGPLAYRQSGLRHSPYAPVIDLTGPVGDTLISLVIRDNGELFEARFSEWDKEFYVIRFEE